MSPERRTGTLVALVLAAIAGALVASRPRPQQRIREHGVTAPRAPELPRDPLAYVPASTLILAVADLEALRRAPAARALFATSPSAPPACAEAIAQRVRRVLLVVPRPRLDDFAFIAEGGVSEAAFTACAQGAQSTTRDGVRIATAASNTDAGSAGTVAWTPSGVMLAGSRALVDAMLQRGLDTMRGEASPLALAPLRRHANERAALWVLALPSPERVPDSDPLAGVTGAAISAEVRDGVSLSTTLLCDDSARARTVAARLAELRADTLQGDAPTWARAFLSGASFEADGSSVKVRASLDAAGVSGVIDGALRATVSVPY